MANVHIRNAIGTVRAVDGEGLLAPETLEQIVQAVLAAVDDRQLRDRRASADTRVAAASGGEEDPA